MIGIGILGASGRMGQSLIKALHGHPTMKLAGAYSRRPIPQEDIQVHIDYTTVFEVSDVILDFTSPFALDSHLHQAIISKKPMVVGTSGLSDAHKKLLIKAGEQIPLVYAENTSMGATLLIYLSRYMARFFDDNFDIEIAEVHHRAKVDAPSGTALAIGRSAARGRGIDFDLNACFERMGVRRPQNIGFAVQRGGSIAGEHSINFWGDLESFSLTHRAFSRDIFAKGALKAASWVMHKDPKLYTMFDVLGLTHEFFRD